MHCWAWPLFFTHKMAIQVSSTKYVRIEGPGEGLKKMRTCAYVCTLTLYMAANFSVRGSPNPHYDAHAWINACIYHIHIHISTAFGTLLDFCRRYGVHYRLQSTCVGSFTCPGTDTQVQGTTASSPIRRTLLVFVRCTCPGPGSNPRLAIDRLD